MTPRRRGFDTVFVMDHFFQLPMLGQPDQEMFEAYTLLGALAARTSQARLGTLVTGVTYREPALLAKVVTALDVISSGRALLGIGAAWFEQEHDALGFEFPPLQGPLRAPRRRARDLPRRCSPRRRRRTPARTTASRTRSTRRRRSASRIPILIGGQGERKTFRLAAQYADELNTTAIVRRPAPQARRPAGPPRRASAATARRSPSRPWPRWSMAETHDAALGQAEGHDRRGAASTPTSCWPTRRPRRRLLGRILWGDPDEVVAQVQELLAARARRHRRQPRRRRRRHRGRRPRRRDPHQGDRLTAAWRRIRSDLAVTERSRRGSARSSPAGPRRRSPASSSTSDPTSCDLPYAVRRVDRARTSSRTSSVATAGSKCAPASSRSRS